MTPTKALEAALIAVQPEGFLFISVYSGQAGRMLATLKASGFSLVQTMPDANKIEKVAEAILDAAQDYLSPRIRASYARAAIAAYVGGE